MKRLHRVRALPVSAACLFFGFAAQVACAGWSGSCLTETGSGVEVEISSPIRQAPPRGCLPCWVTIKNHSGAARSWTIECTSRKTYGDEGNTNISTQTLRVGSGEMGRLPVLLPLDTAPRSSYFWRENSVSVTGYGIVQNTVNVPQSQSNGPSRETAFVGIGEALGVALWEPLKKHWSDNKIGELCGSTVDVSLLGADWRALSGFDALWLTEQEYAGLDAAQRTAIRHWIDLGGSLCLSAQNLNPSLRAGLGLPETGAEAKPGMGAVRVLPWNGKEVPVEEAAKLIQEMPAPRDEDGAYNDASLWAMTKSLGPIQINAPFLIGFICLFAAMVGPVNLFWLADARRRHRLFWTTPLISLAASLLLIVVIVLQDGFGGTGERTMIALLLPDQKKAVVWQEQAARTGILAARQFGVAQDLLLTPVKARTSAGKTYNQAGREYGGDWFASREVQAHRAQAIVPSRAEIQLVNAEAAKNGAPPRVASSVPATLKEVRYVDGSGHRWRGGSLRAGEQIVLESDDLPMMPVPGPVGGDSPGNSKPAMKMVSRRPPFQAEGSDFIRQVVDLSDRPGYFCALAEDGPFIDTLSSIRWRKQQAIFLGPLTAQP